MTPLERRCLRLARAYPAGVRAEEVATTLMETNAERSRPRLADALDVLWHGLATRLGDRSAGTRLGRWGDAAAVALVTAFLMQATVAVALAYRLFENTGAEHRTVTDEYGETAVYFTIPSQALKQAAAVTAALAVVATAAMCLGRVRTARWLTVATALAGVASVVAARSGDMTGAFRTSFGLLVAGIAAALAAAVLFSGGVARAARVAPTWWWGMAAIVCAAVALPSVDIGRGPFGSGRIGVALVAYGVQAWVLLLFATPLVREVPDLFAGSALLTLAMTPWVASVLADPGNSTPEVPIALGLTAVGWVAVGGMATLALRRAPARAADPAD